MSSLCIRGARVLDPARGFDGVADLWIVDGRIAEPPAAPADATLSADGLIAMPGLIDLHVHLREPGGEASETVESGCRAAVAGGFTTIVSMPNTQPAVDTPERVRDQIDKARSAGLCRVLPSACVTRGRAGRELTDFAALAEAGAVAVTDDGNAVPDAALMRRAMLAAAEIGLLIADHCEDEGLVRGGVVNAGKVAERLGVAGRPGSAEDIIVARDLILARETGAPVHLQHLSTTTSSELIRWASGQGVPFTAEATPHHLTLTDEAVVQGGPDFKMNPPLRRRADVDALRAAVADGVIDCIATDHAPHAPEAKARGLVQAPAGVIGMETALAVLWTDLVMTGYLTPLQLVERMSLAPARALRIDAGRLTPGAPADVALFDPRATWCADPERFRSRSRNCPFAGRTLTGRVVKTLVAGRALYEDR